MALITHAHKPTPHPRDHVSAVTFRAFNHTYSDTGLWGAYMAADRLSVDDAMHEVCAWIDGRF